MLKEYTYHVKYSEEKENYLKEKKINYEILMIMEKIPAKIWFRFDSSIEDYETYLKDLELMGDKYSRIDIEYNEKEIEQAEYLHLFPTKQSIDIINEESLSYSCEFLDEMSGDVIYRHPKQNDDFVVRKIPSTKKRTAFWFETIGINYIFTDYRVKIW